MDRRAFLNGLFGVAGAAALAGVAIRTTQAAPLARTLSIPVPDAARQAEGPQAPDGTPVEQVWHRYWHRPYGWRRRYWRRRRRRYWRRRRWYGYRW